MTQYAERFPTSHLRNNDQQDALFFSCWSLLRKYITKHGPQNVKFLPVTRCFTPWIYKGMSHAKGSCVVQI